MKKQLISFAIATVLASSAVHAGDPIAAQPSPEPHRLQAIGLGIGSVAGALIAGPAGLVAGSIVGSLIGWNGSLQEDLGDRQQKLDNTRAELTTLETQRTALIAQAGETASLGTEPDPGPLAGLNQALTADLSLDIYFRSGSALVEPFYEQRLAAIASLLSAFPSLDIELDGYADRRGTDDANIQLASQRLSRVKAALTAAGIDPQRIQNRALGESQPVSKAGDTPAYAFDRRVQLRMSLKQPEPNVPVAQLEMPAHSGPSDNTYTP